MVAGDPRQVPPIANWSRLLEGKIAIVTGGGADGIGGATAQLLAQHGAVVEIAEIDPARGAATRDAIVGAGGRARTHDVDVTKNDQVQAFVDDVLATHGRVDVLVNNVGEFRPFVPFEESTPDYWQYQYALNLEHLFSVTRAVLPTMMKQGSGSIVNVHSVEGMRGYPRNPVYGAMKGAAAHFTTCLAAGYGRYGIRVNAIGPDMTQTPQVDYLSYVADAPDLVPLWDPIGRLGWPEDQARVVLFLASDVSAFVTGHNIPVDGGTFAASGWYFSPTQGRFTAQPRGL